MSATVTDLPVPTAAARVICAFPGCGQDQDHPGDHDPQSVSRETAAALPDRIRRAAVPTAMAIPIELIDVASNVRTELGDLDDLAASIRSRGIREPITVTATPDPVAGGPGRFTVLTGHRRLAAAKLAGVEVVPAIVEHRQALGQAGGERSIEQLIENLQRSDLNPIDEAIALQTVLRDRKLKQADLAREIGRSAPWVANKLALLKTDPEVQERVADGRSTEAHARAIAGLPPAEQRKLIEAATRTGLSAHVLEDEAKRYRERQADLAKRDAKSKAAAAAAVAALEAAGTEKGVKVHVSTSWDMDGDVVATAVQAAGFEVTQEFGQTEQPGCDCTSVYVSVSNPKDAKVLRLCLSEAHKQAAREERDRTWREREATGNREREELRAALVGRLAALPIDGTVARLLLRQMENYNGHTWTEYSAMSDAGVAAEIAAIIARPGGGQGMKPIPQAKVLEALGWTPPAPAPVSAEKPKHPRPQVSLDEAVGSGAPITPPATVQAEAAARVVEKRAARRAAAGVASTGFNPSGVVAAVGSSDLEDDMAASVEAAMRASAKVE